MNEVHFFSWLPTTCPDLPANRDNTYLEGGSQMNGIGVSEGIGIGHASVMNECNGRVWEKDIYDVDREIQKFQKAMASFERETREMAEQLEKNVDSKQADILRCHIMLLQEPMISEEILSVIQEKKVVAEQAVEQVLTQTENLFSRSPQETVRQKAVDFADIRKRLIRILVGEKEAEISDISQNAILITRELTPSVMARLNPEKVVGIVAECGGRTSHAAILARAMGIPTVLGVRNICSKVKDGERIIVDGGRGEVLIHPEKKILDVYRHRDRKLRKEKKCLIEEYGDKPDETKEGIRIRLLCNIEKDSDVEGVVACGGEGIGLFRTEFLFMNRTTMPTEEEQFTVYRTVAETMEGKPVVIRILDAGADKEIPYLNMEQEANPFLGVRGIRFFLQQEDVCKVQLRALLRASAFGNIKIMIPLVTGVEELRQIKSLIQQIMSELAQARIAYSPDIEVGVMMETPAACMVADLLAKEAAFFSIGTNDLIGYMMAADRGNAKVAHLYSAYHPAVLRIIQRTIQCAKEKEIPVSMCGDAATDSKLIPLFVAFGLEQFSVPTADIFSVRRTIAAWDEESAKQLADKVMAVTTEKEVRQLLEL